MILLGCLSILKSIMMSTEETLPIDLDINDYEYIELENSFGRYLHIVKHKSSGFKFIVVPVYGDQGDIMFREAFELTEDTVKRVVEFLTRENTIQNK